MTTTRPNPNGEFFEQMRARLECIQDISKTTARYCRTEDAEGCVLYEHLLNLEVNIANAVNFYALDVPACDRDAITRMVASR